MSASTVSFMLENGTPVAVQSASTFSRSVPAAATPVSVRSLFTSSLSGMT